MVFSCHSRRRQSWTGPGHEEKGKLHYSDQETRGLDIGEFASSSEAIFAVIDTWVETTGKGSKAIFKTKVITQKESGETEKRSC